MTCSRCSDVSRRTFLESTIAALGVSGLAACAAGASTSPAVTQFTVKVSDFPALATVGGIAVVDNGSRSGEPIAVARTASSSFLALSLVCPHRGTTVSVVNSNTSFYCPAHGATFAASGAWTGGQSTGSLGSYPLSYDPTAGTLQIG